MNECKVLVVDDESRMRKLVKDFLVKKDFEVLEASDGEQAIEVFFADKNIDLVILDVMMPYVDGFAVLAAIRAREGDRMPVMMLTARAEDTDEVFPSFVNS